MKSKIQKFLFKKIEIENYLKLLQRSYFILYDLGILKLNENYSYHYFIKKLINKGDIVIDIGANLGYYSILFSRWVGKEGHVYSVEPIEMYNKVSEPIYKNHNNITVYPFALGNEDKLVEMVNPLYDGYLRTGLPHVYDKNTDGKIEDIKYRFNVEMKKPSILFENINKLDYIKCDIEGFEYIVLSEMSVLVNKFKPIVQVEVWDQNDKFIKEMFFKMGYKLYIIKNNKLEKVLNNELKPLSDYIFIHPSKISMNNILN